MKTDLDDVIDEMRQIGNVLVPFNWPQNDPSLENDLHVLKNNFVEIDGYTVGLHFSRADYGSHFIETLQIFGDKCQFLPFTLVAKIGKRFLGDHQLYLVEFIKENRKIYCWTVTLDTEGRPILPKNRLKSEDCDYEGFQYQYMYPNQVNFY